MSAMWHLCLILLVVTNCKRRRGYFIYCYFIVVDVTELLVHVEGMSW